MQEYDILIIGGGPAGLTAAIYALRAGCSVCLIEQFAIGGQAGLTYEIANFPSYENISGYELMMKMYTHAENLGLKTHYGSITEKDLAQKIKVIKTDGEEFRSKAIILAVGATARKLGLKNEQRLTGRGVSYCATCDGAFYKNKTVCVIGGGNTAVEDALHLAHFAEKVYIIHRRKQFKATKILVDKLNENAKIDSLLGYVTEDILGDSKVNTVNIRNVEDNSVREIATDGVFVAIGQVPNGAMFDEISKTEDGYTLVDEYMRTSIDGVYSCGDANKKVLRQVVTACADGAIAGEMCSKYIVQKL